MSAASSVTLAQPPSSPPPPPPPPPHTQWDERQEEQEYTQKPQCQHSQQQQQIPQQVSPASDQRDASSSCTHSRNGIPLPTTPSSNDRPADSRSSTFSLERVKTSYRRLQEYSIMGNLKLDLITLIGVIVTIYFGKRSLDYSKWTNRKDFREACESDVEHNRTIIPECKAALLTPASPPLLRRRSLPLALDDSNGQTSISFSIQNDSLLGVILIPLLRLMFAHPLYFVSMSTATAACLVATTIYFRPRMEPFHPIVSAARDYVIRVIGFEINNVWMCESCAGSVSTPEPFGRNNQQQLAVMNSPCNNGEPADENRRLPAMIMRRRIEALKQDTFLLAKLWMNLSSIKRFVARNDPSVSTKEFHEFGESHDRVEREYILKRSDFRRSAPEPTCTTAVFESFAAAFENWISADSQNWLRLSPEHSDKAETQTDVWDDDCLGLGACEWIKNLDNGKRMRIMPVHVEDPSDQGTTSEPWESILEFTDRELKKAAKLQYPRSHKFTLGIEFEVHYSVYCLRGFDYALSPDPTWGSTLCRMKRSDMKRLVSEMVPWNENQRKTTIEEKYNLLPQGGQAVIDIVLRRANDRRSDNSCPWELVGVGGDASTVEENPDFMFAPQHGWPFFVLRQVTQRDLDMNKETAALRLAAHPSLDQSYSTGEQNPPMPFFPVVPQAPEAGREQRGKRDALQRPTPRIKTPLVRTPTSSAESSRHPSMVCSDIEDNDDDSSTDDNHGTSTGVRSSPENEQIAVSFEKHGKVELGNSLLERSALQAKASRPSRTSENDDSECNTLTGEFKEQNSLRSFWRPESPPMTCSDFGEESDDADDSYFPKGKDDTHQSA